MPAHDELGIRMKENYEKIPKTRLMRRTPAIVRVDGKAFHTFAKGLIKPFDEVLSLSMKETAKFLCENVMNCRLAYVQSDEISLLLTDYETLTSQAFFDYEVQKVCSVTASMATLAFNKAFATHARACAEYMRSELPYTDLTKRGVAARKYGVPEDPNFRVDYKIVLDEAVRKGAMFDSRFFNLPKEEVANYFYWRQLDASRNSVQMVGQANFTQKELHGKSCSKIQDMLHEEKGINWNDLPTDKKRGACCVRREVQASTVDAKDGAVVRHVWTIDDEIPIFKGEGREYVERFVYADDER